MKINTEPPCTPTKSLNDTGSPSTYRKYDDTDQNGMSCVYNSESPTGKTILITNYAASPANINNAANPQKSSITIYTHKPDAEHPIIPTSSINILINNHYDSSLADSVPSDTTTPVKRANIKVERIEAAESDDSGSVADAMVNGGTAESAEKAEPPATSEPFRVGEEILVEQESGDFHLGTIKTICSDSIAVQFDNNQLHWINAGRLKRLVNATTAQQQSMCIVCKNVDAIDCIRICCQCQRGFHDKCLPKANGSHTSDTPSNWCCDKCATRATERLDVMDRRRTITPRRSTKKKTHKFPYDIDALTWDVHHRQNHEQIYCYCGQKGKWFMQMLQCVRCQQWFHAECVKCLNAPLYFGDRFYLFACAHCNHGVEFLRRLHINMEDVVHLLLFNLTLHFSKRFYNLTNVIFPYARDNWPALQLSPKLKNMQANDVKDEILRALKMHTERFKAGNEVKKKISNWALTSRSPPKAPTIVLPQGPLLTEKFINDLFCEQARINYLPQHLSVCDISVSDAKMKDIMFGKMVAGHISTSTDGEAGTTSSDESENVFTSSSDEDILADVIVKEQFRNLIHNEPAKLPDDVAQQPAAPKRKRGRPRLSVPEKSNESSMDISYCSSDDTSSRGTLDSIIPPPENFTGINNPFLFDNNSISATGTRSMARATVKGTESAQPSTSVTKNQVQMVRTVKRRLSVNDLIVGPNMKLKRRKLKQKRLDDDVEVISTTSLAELPASASYLPISSDSRRVSLSALRSTLREQPGQSAKPKDQSKKGGGSDSAEGEVANGKTTGTSNAFGTSSIIGSIPSSPIKETLKDGSLTDLKSSVNMYFGGVVNRIENGESFSIKGKRVLADGRQQYLIEWDGVS